MNSTSKALKIMGQEIGGFLLWGTLVSLGIMGFAYSISVWPVYTLIALGTFILGIRFVFIKASIEDAHNA